jgi:formylglycine-generating enzyme required for sulfatase activity
MRRIKNHPKISKEVKMDMQMIEQTARWVMQALMPYLPKIADQAAQKIGDKIPDAIGTLWSLIHSKFERKDAVKNLTDFLLSPENKLLKDLVTAQLKLLLAEDPDFAGQVQRQLVSVSQNYQTQTIQSINNLQESQVVANNRIYTGPHSKVIVSAGSFGPVEEDSPLPSIESLRQSYLNYIYENRLHLSLGGVDPNAIGDPKAQVNLAAIYTAPYTRSIDEEIAERERNAGSCEDFEYFSALECINRSPRTAILGDPGSGKSTLLNFLALCQAGELLGKKDINLHLLTRPVLPYLHPFDADNELSLPALRPQRWDHSQLIPVLVVLRDFAARGLPAISEIATAEHFWRFISSELDKTGLGVFAPYLRKEMIERGALVLLDGLDEVPSADHRRAQLKQALDDVCAVFPKCHVVVTSRTYAYQKQDWRLRDFSEVTLAPFSPSQICQFVDQWYRHIAAIQWMDPSSALGRAHLLKQAILSHPSLIDLAERPLLLTLMICLHAWRGGNLPEERDRLYEQAVELLLEVWENNKWEHSIDGKVTVRRESITEFLKVDKRALRRLLNRLAFNAHSRQSDLKGVSDIPEQELIAGLMDLATNKGSINLQLVERYLQERAGLLESRGNKVLAFPHRMIQEYLAACHLLDTETPEEIARLGREDPLRWREVVLLACAQAARMNYVVWSLAEHLCYGSLNVCNVTPQDEWGALLAGQCLAESANLQAISIPNRLKLERIQKWLAFLIWHGRIPLNERFLAGACLARLGDPRFDSTLYNLPAEPMAGFIIIPDGLFGMGSEPADDSLCPEEAPYHTLKLPTYYLSRYPVTEAQFCCYLKTNPAHNQDDYDHLANQPVVNVSYDDALGYCRWLADQLCANPRTPAPLSKLLRNGEWRLDLPSEAEWEKAARGTDSRLYPWGNRFDPFFANIDETRLERVVTVGLFSHGASPYGLLDMIGNVWEWTRSEPRSYPYDPHDGREQPDNHAVRVLRGSSFEDFRRVSRCACRDSATPESRSPSVGFRLAIVRN